MAGCRSTKRSSKLLTGRGPETATSTPLAMTDATRSQIVDFALVDPCVLDEHNSEVWDTLNEQEVEIGRSTRPKLPDPLRNLISRLLLKKKKKINKTKNKTT